jgi:SAM-dependent methyltransferase
MVGLSISEKIHPDDQMWKAGRAYYFAVGESGLRNVRRAMALAGISHVQEILDLPCGHGRVARYLRAAFPKANLTVCDLNASGIAFCAAEFDALALMSNVDLCEVNFPAEYNLIWVGSLFTHVDYERTNRWLRHLCGALAPNGLLVATFHGRWAIEVLKKRLRSELWNKVASQCEQTGFGYAPYPDSESMGNYGLSMTKPSKIVEVVESISGIRLLSYMERGWGDNHDVLSIMKKDRLMLWPPNTRFERQVRR